MITTTLLIIASALLVILLSNALVRTLRVYFAYRRFKKDAKGLPMYPFTWSPGGHISEMLFQSYASFKYEPLGRKMGTKTGGGMMGLQRVVASCDLELIKILNFTEAKDHYNKFDNLAWPADEIEYDSIINSQGEQWRRIRHSVAPAFTKHKVHTQNVIEEIEGVLDRLNTGLEARLNKGEEAGEKGVIIDGSDLMARFSTDLIYSCFYKQYNLIDYLSDVDPQSALIEEGLNGVRHPFCEISMVLPILRPIIAKLVNYFHEFGYMKRKLMHFIKQQTALNLQARQEMALARQAGVTVDPNNFKLSDGRVFKHNMADAFIDSYHEGKLTKNEYLNTSLFFILAGVKTVADALAQMLYYLAANQRAQQVLRESLARDGLECEYLSWFINEVLRLTAPVSLGSTRRAERDIKVEDGVVPKGTVVFTHAWTIHRLPEYWGEDANQFRPERWADADKFHPAQYIPFGGGLRGCPGKEFALLTMRKFAVALLARYKVERCIMTSDSPLFQSPLFIYRVSEIPVYVRLQRLSA